MANEINEILRLLIENKESKYSIRKISLIRKINYKSAYNAVKNLHKEGIIDLERLGNNSNCSFNNNFSERVFSVEYKRREDLLKNKDFKVIFSRLNKVLSPFICLVFGSYSKGKNNKNSDIDLLFITDNEKEINKEISIIPKVHATIISFDEFVKMAKINDFSVVKEAIKHNIILVGIENYYKLINNVR
jgi:predicted nucleotidyltransferase